VTEQKEIISPPEDVAAKKEKTRQLTSHNFDPTHVYAVSATMGIAISLVYAFQSFYPDLIGSFSNILTPVSASAAFVCSLLCTRKYGFKIRSHSFDRIWFLFTIGMLLWAIGESTWTAYYFSGTPVPYPSIADFSYLGGYIPLLLATFLYFRAFSSVLTKRRTMIALATIVICALFVFELVLPTEFAGNPSFLKVIDDLSYLILDMTLLSLTILSLAIFFGGTVARWWTVLAAGFAVQVIGDEVFFFQNAQGTYYNGSISDLVYILGYLLLALAFYIHRKEL
jgi:hypothetical protein